MKNMWTKRCAVALAFALVAEGAFADRTEGPSHSIA